MSYSPVAEVRVGLRFADATIPVGRLAVNAGRIYFEYEAEFLQAGLDISPLCCPLRAGVQRFDAHFAEGLPGVFDDSLADGWGRLLLDRRLRALGAPPGKISPLDRLVQVGNAGMGALVYQPFAGNAAEDNSAQKVNLDRLAEDARSVLQGSDDEVLQKLLTLAGSSSGARPKAMIAVDAQRTHLVHGTAVPPSGYTPWLVKFPGGNDGADAGAVEYAYARMATEAGIEMSEAHLFSARMGAGYFAARRFDRNDGRRLHFHSACGLLHSGFRQPTLDYQDLLTLTMHLTRDVREVEKMFRMAAFNVLAHNRDDHSKNFGFLMDSQGQWRLAPAYDLTFAHGINGEQSTTVMGEGANPTRTHLYALGEDAKLSGVRVQAIVDETCDALSRWRALATEYGVARQTAVEVEKALAQRLAG